MRARGEHRRRNGESYPGTYCKNYASLRMRTSRLFVYTHIACVALDYSAVVYIGASYAYNARTVGALGARGIRGMLACVLMTVLWSAGLFGW